MAKKYIAALLLSTLLSASVKADIVVPGEVYRQFLISNIDKFPAYKFYFIYQGYHYDQGYHANKPDTILVENGKRYQVSSHGNDKSALLVVDKNGQWSVSDILLGGESKLSPSISGVVDVYSITTIKNHKIKLKKLREIILYANGKEKEKKAGDGFSFFITGDGFMKGLIITSSIAMLALLVLFMKTRRKPAYVQMAT